MNRSFSQQKNAKIVISPHEVPHEQFTREKFASKKLNFSHDPTGSGSWIPGQNFCVLEAGLVEDKVRVGSNEVDYINNESNVMKPIKLILYYRTSTSNKI